MSKTFRSWDVDQGWLLPPSVHDFVPAGHLAHFVRDTVREGLDLSAIMGVYDVDRGQPPYHPGMMTALLLYGYSRGVYSSRRLAQACEERVDFMAVTGLNRPDFRTVSDFRRRHLGALSDLFVQVLRLCQTAGLVKLGHVAVDGTKLKANASRHKAMSYGRMKTAEPKLAAEVAAWMAQAEAADRAEDAEHGAELRGDETPDWMADKQRRLERIREARARLEAEAASDPTDLDPEGPGPSSGMQARGNRKKAPDGAAPPSPPDKAQRNFTDGDSRVQPTRDGYIAGFNGQIAVDAAHQIIVAQRLATNPADYGALIPLGRSGQGQSGPQTQGSLRRHRLRQRGQYRRNGEAKNQRLPHAGAKQTPRRACRRRARLRQPTPDDRHGAKTKTRRAKITLPTAKTDRRAGVRSDQAGQRIQAVPSQRPRQGQSRMEPHLHRPQPAEAGSSAVTASQSIPT